MPKEISYGFVVVRRTEMGDRFLLVKQHLNWSFPKGHIEAGEEPLVCAKRELFEETGITEIQVIPDISFYEEYVFDRNGVQTKKENTFFLGIVHNTETIAQEGEISECRFVSYEEALKIVSFENPKRIVQEAIVALSKI